MWALVKKYYAFGIHTLWINLNLFNMQNAKNIIEVYAYEERKDLDKTKSVAPVRKADPTTYNFKF